MVYFSPAWYDTNSTFLTFQRRHVRDQVVSFPVGLFHDHKQDVEEDYSGQVTPKQRTSYNMEV